MAGRKEAGSGPTIEQLRQALSGVEDPELHKDLISLNMIRDLKVEDGRVSFTLMLTTPACPLRDRIAADARAAVEAVPGVGRVDIRVDAAVPASAAAGALKPVARNTVAVASGKGGVGKTTVAVNVAVSLARAGSTVGLLDADIYGPNVPTMMGIGELPPLREDRILPAESHGVKVVSIGLMVEPGRPLVWRGPMLHSAVRQLLSDVDWGYPDYLIVDLPPGTGDVQISLAQLIRLSGGIVVTLPQKVAREDASRGLEMFRLMNVPVLGVVENMSYWAGPDGAPIDLFGRGGGKELAEQARVPFLGEIPIDPQVRIGGDAGRPIVVAHPESPAAAALKSIAEQTAARISVLALQSGGVGGKPQA
ncbi:MAG: Mrp/NBP35 family ATP-binding protein [Anaerolineales bacterium]|nr:Mrp/NBP35 family ATP-binding protein [Anaerolineales bacterium]